jgi:signal peptidase I
MGDHRNASADSRYHCGPGGTDGDRRACDAYSSTVPVKDVIGKAFVIAWPPSRWRTLGTPSTFTSAAGASLGAGVFLVRRRRRR